MALDRKRVWHPYTAMQEWRERADPLVIVRAEGVRLFDADGRAYLDANASWWTATLGHGHPRLLAALRRQSEQLAHVALAGIAHEPAAELAEALCAVAPPFAVPSMPHRFIWSERLTNDPALRWLRGLLVDAFEIVLRESASLVARPKARRGKS